MNPHYGRCVLTLGCALMTLLTSCKLRHAEDDLWEDEYIEEEEGTADASETPGREQLMPGERMDPTVLTGSPLEAPPASPLTSEGRWSGMSTELLNVRAPEPHLLPGDRIRISVMRQPELDQEVRIPSTGFIGMHLIGTLDTSGMTTEELAQTLETKLGQEHLKHPVVTVSILEYAPREIYLLGGVNKPGTYAFPMSNRLSLLQAIAGAEGFSDRAVKDAVWVLRRNETSSRMVIRVSITDLERNLADRTDSDFELWPEDLVVIPTVSRLVYVLGAVQKPGSVEMPVNRRMTVSMAVSSAGSYTKFAATRRVQILRQDPNGKVTPITVDLNAILNGQPELDIDLKPGDVVWMPERGLFS